MLLNFKKLKSGHKVLGVIKQVNDFDLVVSLPSHLTGFVSFEQVSQHFAERFEAAAEAVESDSTVELTPLTTVYQKGQYVLCQVAAVEKKPKKRIELSLKAALVNSGKDETDLSVGAVVAAEVQSSEDKGYRVGFGVEGTVGFLPFTEVDGDLQVGQSIPVVVKNVSSVVQVSTKLTGAQLKDANNVASLGVGCLLSSEVVGVAADHVRVKFAGGLEGKIETFQLPQAVAFTRSKDFDLAEHFQPGQKLKCRIVWFDPEEKEFALSAKEETVSLATPVPTEIVIGEAIEGCSVLRVEPTNGLLLELPGSPVPAWVHISRLSDEHVDKISGAKWKVGSRHTCRIVDFDPFDGLFQACMKASTLKEQFVRIEDVQPGMLVKGTVSKVESFGILVQLTDHIRAICPTAHLTETQSGVASKKYSVGTKYRFRVVDVDAKARRITLTRKAGLISSDLAPLTSISDAKVGSFFDGYIAAIKPFGLLVRFYNGVKGLVPTAEISDEYVENPQAAFFEGQVIRCRVIRCNPQAGELNLSLRKTDGPKANRPKPKAVKVVQADKEETEQVEQEADLTIEMVEEPVKKKAKKVEEEPAMCLDDLVEEEEEPKVEEIKQPKLNLKQDPSAPSLREVCDEFERRLIGQPNSSFLWIQYMSALLRASELEEARKVAERALSTIRYRDEQEKTNVWVAYLNLEHAFGTQETLQKVFSRSIVYADPKKMHIALVKIYEESPKEGMDLAEDLHKVMIKKFSQSCKIWVGYMAYQYQTKKDVTGARRLLPQALKSLPKRKHIKITCKVAQLEYKHASIERGRTLFEGVLANAPKRVDIWSVYLAQEESHLLKGTPDQADIDSARRVFERVVHLRMSSKKAKFFFKRFLDFEKQHGTEETVEHVKELARTYVESNMSS